MNYCRRGGKRFRVTLLSVAPKYPPMACCVFLHLSDPGFSMTMVTTSAQCKMHTTWFFLEPQRQHTLLNIMIHHVKQFLLCINARAMGPFCARTPIATVANHCRRTQCDENGKHSSSTLVQRACDVVCDTRHSFLGWKKHVNWNCVCVDSM